MKVSDKFAWMTQQEFDDLPEYSATLPTGQTIGKRWKRDVNEPRRFHGIEVDAPKKWMMGEYSHREGSDIIIRWRKLVVVTHPKAIENVS